MTTWMAVLEKVLHRYGLHDCSCEVLQDFKNTSFKLHNDGRCYFAKVHHGPQVSLDLVLAEQQWLQYLGTQMPAPIPCATKDGRLALEVAGRESGRRAVVTIQQWIDGTVFGQDARCPEHFYHLGLALAQMHNAALSWELPNGFARPVAAVAAVEDLIDYCSEHVVQHVATPADCTLLASLLADLKAVEADWAASGGQRHIVHNDPSFGNVLFQDGQPVLIDYDDMRLGFAYVDLGVVLAGPLAMDDFADKRDALFAGYNSAAQVAVSADKWHVYTAYRTLNMIWGAACSPADSPQRGWLPGQLERLRLLDI